MAALALVFGYAPTEATMGEVQRIVYLHVSVAWCGLAGCIAMGACAAGYLVRRRLAWDHWGRAGAEIGWLCLLLTLITGSLWAHEAWGVWWVWEPRLTSAFVLWLLLSGIGLVRSGIEEPHHQARVGAVLALVAVADIPLVVMATRWFRGMHPVTPEMDPRMRLVLLTTAVSFSLLFAAVAWQRRKQLELVERTETLAARLLWCDG
jgi:heme exporter protein C